MSSDINNIPETCLIPKDSDLEIAIDKSLETLTLDEAENKIIQSIIDAPDSATLKKQFELFNINQSKKNAVRVAKLNGLLDKVEDQAIKRFEHRPDQVSNKELLEYMNVVSNQIDRAQQSIETITETKPLVIEQQKNEVNINVGQTLDKDSKERVMDAIANLLKQVKKGVAENTIVPEDDSSAKNIEGSDIIIEAEDVNNNEDKAATD